MASNLERYKMDLDKLISLGERMYKDLLLQVLKQNRKITKKQKEAIDKYKDTFDSEYHNWYNQAFSIIKYLLPERLIEFESYYKWNEKRKTINLMTFSIQDWLAGRRAAPNEITGKKAFDDLVTISSKFNIQLEILKSVKVIFESSLFNIKQLLQADLLDSEIDASKELLKNGYLRASGVVAGVVLETHLLQVCNSHNITIRKKNPTINDFNETLKQNNVIDTPNWRFIQRLGDIRNLCGHKKVREPLKEEVEELINGVDKITKTLY